MLWKSCTWKGTKGFLCLANIFIQFVHVIMTTLSVVTSFLIQTQSHKNDEYIKYSQVSVNKMTSSATEDSSSRGLHTFSTRTLMGSDEVSSS